MRIVMGRSLYFLILITLLLIHGNWTKAKGNGVKIISQKVICKEPGRYIGWPTITKTHEEELLIVFSGDRDAHVCPWGKVQMVRSSDSGAHWSMPVTIYNTPLDDRDPGILVTKEGTLLVSRSITIGFENRPQYYQHAKKISPDVHEYWPGFWINRSTDGGKTWEEPIKTNGYTPHGPIQLRDGRLIYIMNCWDVNWTNQLVAVEESQDYGCSWNRISIITSPTGERLDEPHVAETSNGKLIAMFRCQPKDDRARSFLRQSESNDGGKTWSSVHETPIWGFPPHIIQLNNGWMLVTYGRRLHPYGIRACISRDEGETWDIEHEIILNRALNTDLGYPSSVQLDDGSIWTVYYMVDKPGEKPCLIGTHWRLK